MNFSTRGYKLFYHELFTRVSQYIRSYNRNRAQEIKWSEIL